MRTLELERSGEIGGVGRSLRRNYGRSNGRRPRAQALLTGSQVVAGPATSPVGAEEVVAAGATAALHVSRPCQASLAPRRFAFVHGPRRARRGPGGYCRHSGNQGTTGRPARAHKILWMIFAKDQALQAWRASRGFSPREGFFSSPRILSLGEGSLLDKASPTPPAILLRTKLKGSARLFASPRLLPHEAISASAAERTRALRHVQSDARACAR